MTAVATERAVRHLSVDQLRDVLATQLNGSAPVGLTIRTRPEMTGGKSCPYKDRVEVETTFGAFVGFNYQRAVNRRREREGKEGDFVPSPRPWGQRIQGTPLVEHKGSFYLEYTPMRTHLARTFLDGRLVLDTATLEDIERWRKRSSNAAHQGLETEFKVRTVSLENIRSIRCLGEDITVHRAPVFHQLPAAVLVRDFAALSDGDVLIMLGRLLNEIERRQGQPV
jgi:hypothetical protein